MPNFCAVVGCSLRSERDRVSFFRIPCCPKRGSPGFKKLKQERRHKWIAALKRSDLTETKLKYATICERHFISGRPADIHDVNSPDWVPSINMGYSKNEPEVGPLRKFNRIKRLKVDSRKEIPNDLESECTQGEDSDLGYNSAHVSSPAGSSTTEAHQSLLGLGHNSASVSSPVSSSTTDINQSSLDNKHPESLASNTFPRIVKITGCANESSKVEHYENSIANTFEEKFCSNSGNNVQIPELNSIYIPFLNMPVNLLVETQIKEEAVLHQDLEMDNVEIDDGILNGDSDSSQDVTEESHFSFLELIRNSEQIHKPNPWWTVSGCKDFLMCAKWDAAYACRLKVVICEDLTVKVFVKNVRMPLDIKIDSYESISSLLKSTEALSDFLKL